MSPITHFLASWVVFEPHLRTDRDRVLVLAAGLAPDLDGIGIIIDFAMRALGLMPTDYYQGWHRHYAHGIAAALLLSALAAWYGTDRYRAAIAAFLCVHLHFLCDLAGSRGSTASDLWGLYYLGPFDKNYEWVWGGQWPLIGWQNTCISIVLMLLLLFRACHTGYSPLGLINARADAVFVAVLRDWRQRLFSRP